MRRSQPLRRATIPTVRILTYVISLDIPRKNQWLEKLSNLLHSSDPLLKKSANINIDPGAVTTQGRPRSSNVVEKCG